MMENLDEAELCFPQLNSSCRKPTQPPTEALLIYILLSSMSLLTVALNLLVIIAISHFRQLHTPTNVFLLSLAVSDLLVGFVLMPVEIIYIEACWFLGDVVCTLYYVIDYIITSTSVANMVLISADRYVAICDPLHYPTRVTKRRAQIGICLCWVCSVLYRIFFLHSHLTEPERSHSCLGECVVVVNKTSADLIVSFLGPILIIIILYLRVFVVAVSQARAMRSHVTAVTHQQTQTVKPKKSEIKAARTLGVVVAVFLLCSAPYYCFIVAHEYQLIGEETAGIEIWLLYINSCVNPMIYVFFYPWFRKAIRHIVTLQILQPGSSQTRFM
uniref:G-protein coupled receptors family 1 profile domain-containing protein n=1 Tax=Echeneis naucrates TaxID=173247 RepID=A0A665WXC6_ECHNA